MFSVGMTLKVLYIKKNLLWEKWGGHGRD